MIILRLDSGSGLGLVGADKFLFVVKSEIGTSLILCAELILMPTPVDVPNPIVVRSRNVRADFAGGAILGPDLVLVLLRGAVVLVEPLVRKHLVARGAVKRHVRLARNVASLAAGDGPRDPPLLTKRNQLDLASVLFLAVLGHTGVDCPDGGTRP